MGRLKVVDFLPGLGTETAEDINAKRQYYGKVRASKNIAR